MQNRPCDVTPTSEQDKYSVALQDETGRWYGLDVPLNNIIPTTLDVPDSLTRVGLNSFHQGRGADKFTPDSYNYYDSMNLWSTTPGKAHATQLFRWAKGLRDADFNMPNANGVKWVPLINTERALSVSFVASASYTVAKIIILLRKRVPAGTTGVPGTLGVKIKANSSGKPNGSALVSATLTAAELADVVSEYHVFSVSLAITSGTTYHVVVVGASTDKKDACWEIACDPTVAGWRHEEGDPDSWTFANSSTFSPYFRVTDADTARVFKQFLFDDALYLVSLYKNGTTSSKLYINGLRGKATSGSTTSLVDTGHGSYGATNLTTDRFVGAYLRAIRGTGAGQVALITANTADTFSFAAVDVAFDNTTEYVVYGTDWFVEIGTTGLGVVTGEPVVQNGVVYFPQGDSTDIRIMHMDYTDADDHAFDAENSKHNKATLLTAGYDSAQGPQVWRMNKSATTGSTPNAAAISVARAPSSPASGGVPTPLTWGTDLTFQRSIPCGDNTNLINGIIFHDGALYALKDDSIFVIQNDVAVQLKLGTDRAPKRTNGLAATVGANKQLYVSYLGDVFLITGGGAYPTGMKTNMPSSRLGYVNELTAGEGWLFAAVNAGTTGDSSVMKFSLDTQTWSEQLRSFYTGRRIDGIAWQDCSGTRPRLWINIEGEMIYQEFPLNSARPYDDPNLKYQHEAVMVLPTIDMNTVDPKYYATLSINSQGLASEADTERGHEIVVEYQADNDVGSASWRHVGFIRTSPTGSVNINVGNTRMLRLRLRMISDEAIDPVIVETLGITLFSRNKLSRQWQMYFKVSGDDEEQNGLELLRWLRDAYGKAQPLRLFSRFRLYHDRRVTLTNEPFYRLDELDPEADEIEAEISVTVREVL